MTIATGSRVGPYEIAAQLGEGGMGVVFRARDTRLGRDVAIKVLPEALSVDPERVSRFQREAQILASLNHPHIGAIHDLTEFGDSRVLILELVEGETLAERIVRGPIPIEEALQIARQIAEALEAAHEKGIVHRDLKPANIKITPDGNVKVLDFGLAKISEGYGANPVLSNSPTMMSASMPGVVVGTAAYMSPEQAKGRETDRTTDAWAFGCVLYEMLTGRAPFIGETLGEIIAEVFKSEPDWSLLPGETPPLIRRLLRRCLEKDRRKRLQHLGDARLEISEALDAPSNGDQRVSLPRNSVRGLLLQLAVLAIVAALAYFAGRWQTTEIPNPSPVRLEFSLPEDTRSVSVPGFGALSPDGQYFAFVGDGSGGRRLWLRNMETGKADVLMQTEAALYPFWSPDSKSLAFFSEGKLKRLDLPDGPPRILADAPDNRGGAWLSGGTIVFCPLTSSGLFQVSAQGGATTVATTVELARSEIAHRYPAPLPDGKHFTYHIAAGQPDAAGAFVGSVEDPATKTRLLSVNSTTRFISSGKLLYVSDGTLFAQPFDPVRLSFTGEPSAIVTGVASNPGLGSGSFTTSDDGMIAFQSGPAAGTVLPRRLAWFNRTTKQLQPVGEETALYVYFDLSPDESRVVIERQDPVWSTDDVWIMDLKREAITRLTSDRLFDQAPIWSPDGSEILFFSNRSGLGDLYRKIASGALPEEPFFKSEFRKWTSSWSSDGKILFESRNQNNWDLMTIPTVAAGKPVPFLATAANERQGRFSPNNRWVAYVSDESGKYEVYVQSFPPSTTKVQISTQGGGQPAWRSDGSELFFLSGGKITSVLLQFRGNEIDVGVPVVAMDAVDLGPGITAAGSGKVYAVTRDASRFLILLPPAETPNLPISFILNHR